MTKECSRPIREIGAAVTGPEQPVETRPNVLSLVLSPKDRLRRPGLPLKRILVRIPEPFND